MVQQDKSLVSDYGSEFEQFYECKYYYTPEGIITRFVRGLGLPIQQKMHAYTIYTLKHTIHLAMQIHGHHLFKGRLALEA